MKPTIVIEHLEPEMSLWILLEYRHAGLIVGDRDMLWFTNIPARYKKILDKYGRVYEKSILELVPQEKIVILDPQAEKPLTYDDLLGKYVVIGGILGDYPPRGRTKELLSSRAPRAEKRNIGEGQYSIDGTVYYVMYLWKHGSMNEFKYVDGVKINTNEGHIFLPFRYPVEDNRPILAPGLKEYLLSKRVPDHILKEISSNEIIEDEKN